MAARTQHDGQAMVEFVVALFAIVLIVAGISDFIAAATRRSEICSALRGRAGAAAMASSASDAAALVPGDSTPRPITSESALSARFLRKAEREEFPLSHALRGWLHMGGKDTISIGGEVWMPPLVIQSAGSGDAP